MKRIIILILCLGMLLCGCESEPSEIIPDPTIETSASEEISEPTVEINTEPETLPQETYPVSGVYDGEVILGNITFEIPDDFVVTVVNELSFVLSSSDGACAIALSAVDISELDEENSKKFLPMVNESLINFDDLVVAQADDIIGEIGGFPVTLRACGTYDGSNMVFHADTTFTDSWYAYTIIYKSDMESEKHSDYNSLFVNFIMFSEHNGREVRFDFVQ